MIRWQNQPLTVYHGTDSDALPSGSWAAGSPIPFKVDLTRGQPFVDFGQAFYTTTNEHQAEQWANMRVLRRASVPGLRAVVLAFTVDRDQLAGLDSLTFVRPTRDFWDLVWSCRNGFTPHGRSRSWATSYDVVYGPVTLWPQLLLIGDCDQISFHTPRAAAALASPVLHAEASAYIF